MITKFSGKCELCGGAIPAGEDVYFNVSTKKISHYGCSPKTEKPSVKGGGVELAERLGFIDAQRTDWTLRDMYEATDRPATGRPGADARRRDSLLWGEEES